MFAANTPVSSRPAIITITPRPGTCLSASSSGVAAAGSTACDALSSAPNTLSSVVRMACRTQIVMASGSQTRSPAMRYFFTKVASERACQWQAQEPPQAPPVVAADGDAAGSDLPPSDLPALGLAAV